MRQPRVRRAFADAAIGNDLLVGRELLVWFGVVIAAPRRSASDDGRFLSRESLAKARGQHLRVRRASELPHDDAVPDPFLAEVLREHFGGIPERRPSGRITVRIRFVSV